MEKNSSLNKISELEKRVERIENRNKRVESDKAWEGSWSRKGLIILLSYISIATYLWIIGNPNPLVNAIGAPIGFTLSTLTFSFIKIIWIKTNT